jgi:hypothetical protein
MPGEIAVELRRRARNAGWRRIEGKDICPDCIKGAVGGEGS